MADSGESAPTNVIRDVSPESQRVLCAWHTSHGNTGGSSGQLITTSTSDASPPTTTRTDSCRAASANLRHLSSRANSTLGARLCRSVHGD